jgi:ornithine cyclodeaminase/alanine dehydrogenase-like protein (mu-crystallin family)
MPLWLSEDDVGSLITPADGLPVIERCFARMAASEVDVMPRRRLPLDDGYFAVMAATDRGLGVGGLKSYTLVDGKLAFVVCLFDLASGALTAMLAADRVGQIRTGAASGVAARHLARRGARSLGLIGAGWQAASQLEAIRVAVPTIERVVVTSRTRERAESFAAEFGADVAESPADAGGCDVVVTVTTADDPVLRGDWLCDGTLVIGVGANGPSKRELDAQVIARASFVCTDSLADAKLEAGDLIEPVASGQLDWLEVHELHEVVAGEVSGRQSDADVVVFKSNGIAPWDVALAAEIVERARTRGVGVELPASG